MKINITKKEYALLLDIFEMGIWVLNAHQIGEDPERDKYLEVEQKFYSFAKDFGYGKYITYDKKLKEYFATQEFEDKSPAHDYISEFENDSFWEELIRRLAQRDLIRQEGREKYLEMDGKERFTKEGIISEKYSDEFEENGLENLEVKLNP